MKKKSKLTPEMEKAKFKPGQSGNPHGRPPINPAQKALKNLTIATYREVIELVLTGNLTELKAMAEHKDTPAVQVGIATAFMKAIKTGDYAVIERIAERIIGKIPDELNVNSINNTTMNAKVQVIDKTAIAKALAEIKGEIE